MLDDNSPLLRLPPEIRNQIMLLVLHPGHIYLHQMTIFNKRMLRQGTLPTRVTSEFKSSNSGPGLLATCRQLYREWHEFYYSSNVFHIPTSSIKTMQPNHRALVQHVGFRLSLSDIIPSKTEEVERLTEVLAEESKNIMGLEGKENILYPLCCAAVLLEAWLSNILSIQESFSELKTLCIEIRTQVEPQRLLRLVIAAKNINTPRTGYRFRALDLNNGREFRRLKRKWHEQYRLDVNVGGFLDFAVQQALGKVSRDIPLRTGTWANFKDSVDADFVKKYDNEILGHETWSYQGWEKWEERIDASAVSVELS